MTKKILVIYAHPNSHKSRVNKHFKCVATHRDNAAVRDLYELYPNMLINASVEQEAVAECDVLVFQFPIYWFSSPAILKEWQDTVLSSGFAYGDGKVLAGKEFMVCLTTGGTEQSYCTAGKHGAPLDAYLAPFHQTARFCDMKVLKPFIVQGIGQMQAGEIAIEAQKYQELLMDIQAGKGQYLYGG